ncbi:hypothetical protein WCP94_004486 [Bilophila wadsworthia]
MWECFALCRWAGERTPGCLPYDLLWTLRKRRKGKARPCLVFETGALRRFSL